MCDKVCNELDAKVRSVGLLGRKGAETGGKARLGHVARGVGRGDRLAKGLWCGRRRYTCGGGLGMRVRGVGGGMVGWDGRRGWCCGGGWGGFMLLDVMVYV